MPSRARRYVQCLSSSVIGLVRAVLDSPQIWCIVTRLFMSPITSQSSVSYRTVRLGGYRLLDLAVIGAMVICLFVIGLAGAMVIGRSKVSKISENITGRDMAGQALQVTGPDYYREVYYPGGILGLLRVSSKLDGMEILILPGQDGAAGQDMDGIHQLYKNF